MALPGPELGAATLEERGSQEVPRTAALILTLDAPTVGTMLLAEYRSLVSYSRRLTSNGPEAADLVQMVCARVLSQPTTTTRPVNVSAWLRKILFRLFVDLRRRAKWEIPMDVAALGPAANDIEPHLPPATVEDVRALVELLPAHYRVPYELFTFKEMSYEGIAARLGLPCKTVATRINRARKRLRGLLQARPRR